MQMVLTAVGSAIGGPVGGFVGGIIGAAADRALFGPGDTRSAELGLESLSVSVSTDGHLIQDGAGTHPRIGRLIWSAPKKENRTSETTEGGKDFGGPEHTTERINPTVTCAYSFGWGPGRPIWIKANKRTLVDFRPTAVTTYAPGVKVNIMNGNQNESSYLADSTFPSAPAYRGQIVVEFENLPIRQFGDDPPQVLEAMVVMDGASVPASTNILLDDNDINSAGYQYYDADRGYLWVSFDAVNMNPRENVVGVVDVNTREWVFQTRYPSVEGSHPGGIRKVVVTNPDLTFEEWILVNEDDFLRVYDADSLSLKFVHTRTSGGSILTVANERGLLSYKSGGGGGHKLSLWSQYSKLDIEQNLQNPTGYSIKLQGICEYSETFLFFLNKTVDNTLALAEWQIGEINNSGDFGPILDQTQFDGGVSWNVVDDSVYAASTNTYFCPGTVSYGSGLETVLFEISTNATLVETIRLPGLGYTPNVWGIGTGDPAIFYGSERDEIYWRNGTLLWRYALTTRRLTSVNLNSAGGWGFYHVPTDTVFSSGFGDSAGVIATKIDTVDSAKVPISTAIQRLCLQAGIDISQINVAGITETMWGAPTLVGQPARTSIEALLKKANGYGVLTSNQIRFMEFGGSTVRSFKKEELGAIENGTQRQSTLTEGFPEPYDIPAIVDLAYINIHAEGENTIARSMYHFESRVRPVRQKTTVVLDSAEAATLVNRWHQSIVNRKPFEGIRLIPKHLDMDPGDIIEITEDGQDNRRILITDQVISPTLGMMLKGISEDDQDSVSSGVGAFDQVLTVVSSTANPQVIVLDTALLRDADSKDHPGMYVAVFRTGSTTSNTNIYGSASGETYNPLVVVPSNASVGLTTSALSKSASLDAWDESVVQVEFVSGSAPSSLTDADILAGGNACAVGRAGRWEIIQPATWTLISGTTYEFTHTLRGRRGTDPYIGTHQANDYLVVLDSSVIRRLVLSATLIDTIYNIKAVAPGGTLSEAPSTTVNISGNPMKPYSVVDLAVDRVTSTHTWSWVARTRAGGVYGGTNSLIDGYVGAQVDGLTFEIEIWNLTQTIRYNTRTVTEELFTYLESMRTTDGLGASQEYVVKIFHMNGTIRGHEVSSSSLGQTYSEIALALGPVIGYVMDETTGTTADNIEGSSGRDGAYSGTYTLAQPTIISGEAYSVAFPDGRIVIPDVPLRNVLLQVPGVTIAAMIDVTDLSGISQTEIFRFASGSQEPVTMKINNLTSEIEAGAQSNFFTGKVNVSVPFTAGTYFVALTVDPPNDRLVLYVDGIEASVLDPAGFGFTTDFRGLDGGVPSGGKTQNVFDTQVAHGQGAYVYSRALSAEEVAALAASV